MHAGRRANPPGKAERRQLAGRLMLLFLLLGVLLGVLAGPLAAPALAGAPAPEPPTAGLDAGLPRSAAPEFEETASLLTAVFKAIGALALVLALIVLLASGLRKMGWGREAGGRSSFIQVLETRMIAPKKYVAVLRVASEVVAVGITDQQITLLTKLEGEDLPDTPATAGLAGPPALFSSALRRALGRQPKRDNS